jgi:Plavaka transposase
VLNIGGEKLEFYSRDGLECIRSLYGDPQFTQDLVFAPERHYTSRERTSRLYNEMYTCDWWWTVQVRKLQYVRMKLLLISGVRQSSSPVNPELRSFLLLSPLTRRC